VATIVRLITFATVMTGCSFMSPPRSPEVIEPSPTPPAAQPCGTNAQGVVNEQGVALCVDFEDQPLAAMAVDRSPNQNHAIAVAVGSIQRPPGEQAALLSKASSLRVPESAALDLTRFTIEMWIRPDQAPKYKDGDAGLFDNFGQYTMRLQNDLRVRCGLMGDHRVSSQAAVPTGAWSHVACRYTDGEMRVYINGHLSDCQSVGAITQLGLLGSAIGSELSPIPGAAPKDRFLGGVDNVRIYDHPLEEDRICTAAGWPTGSCETACPSSEESSGRGD
jgi:hypothetical protein